MQLYSNRSIRKMVIIFVLFMLAVFVATSAIMYLEWTQTEECKTDLYLQAVSFEKDEDFVSAHGVYQSLCEGAFYIDAKKPEHPCAAASRTTKRLNDALGDAVEAVSKYRNRENKYPNTLAVVLNEVHPSNQRVVEQFHLCRKIAIGEGGYRCAGELEAYSGADISILTGQESSANFDLNRKRKNSRSTVSCQLN
jgi:hypothetical protein